MFLLVTSAHGERQAGTDQSVCRLGGILARFRYRTRHSRAHSGVTRAKGQYLFPPPLIPARGWGGGVGRRAGTREMERLLLVEKMWDNVHLALINFVLDSYWMYEI